MTYKHIRSAIFKHRPNRFIADCEVDGENVVCHVKNTGRCRELFIPGCQVYLEESATPSRKTRYDLVAVRKGDLLFNVDSTAPNQVVAEWLAAGGLFPDTTMVKAEATYGQSRFDFYVEHGDRLTFLEVKGVTLEQGGVLLFPDAPTERGVKHIHELCHALEAGYEAYMIFVVQTDRAAYFTPNRQTHPAFADALTEASKQGVQILCYTCHTTPERLTLGEPIEVRL